MIPKRVPLSRPQPAHAVAHVHAVGAARALDRPMVHREDDGVALPQRHHLGPRLQARALLGEDELAAGEIRARLGEQDRHLQGEDVLAVEILVQAVEVTGLVLQQQRRRPRLPGRVAPLEEPACSSGKRTSTRIAAFQRLAISASGG